MSGEWRVVVTDTERLTGVAPACPQTATNHLIEDHDGAPFPEIDEIGVYDCCPHPHIECWSEANANFVMTALNLSAAEVCS